jgi:hypothetical protein
MYSPTDAASLGSFSPDESLSASGEQKQANDRKRARLAESTSPYDPYSPGQPM